VFTILVSAFQLYVFYRDETNRYQQKTEYLTEVATQSVSTLLWSLDTQNIRHLSKILSSDEILRGIVVASNIVMTEEQLTYSGYIDVIGDIEETHLQIAGLFPGEQIEVRQQPVLWNKQALGTITLFFDPAPVDAVISARFYGDIFYLVLKMMVFGMVLFIILSRNFLRPFKKSHALATSVGAVISEFNRELAEEKYDFASIQSLRPLIGQYSEEMSRKDEVGDFFRAFSVLIGAVVSLVGELSQYSEELKMLNDELESRVKERTEELSASNEKLKASYEDLKFAQTKMMQQEKLASIGQLAAGVAHEINNPVGYVSSNINRLQEYFDSLQQLIEAYRKILQEEKGEATQKKVASIDAENDLQFILDDLPEIVKECLEGVGRVQEIVRNLKDFSRVDDAGKRKLFNINDAIESTLKLVWNELKYDCNVEKELLNESMVEANYGQINQVISNLLVNASHAIKDTGKHGQIFIKSWSDDARVCFSVEDSGTGMPDDVRKNIFDPFFTTKPVGKGTGLGLNISYDIIVNQHKGEIEVNSTPGAGSTFTIRLPLGNTEQSID
jgi:signal transduction histidine kinase